MQIVPVLPVIEEDELLVSYLYRTSIANKIPFGNYILSFYGGNKWRGLGPIINNFAEQLSIEPVYLFLDHTTFGYEQIFMSRADHKGIIPGIFDPEYKGGKTKYQLHNDFDSVLVCRQCLEEKRYIRRRDQLGINTCEKHYAKLHRYFPDDVFQSEIELMKEKSENKAKGKLSVLDIQILRLLEGIMNEHLILDYEEVIDIIEANYTSSHYVKSNISLSLEYDRIFQEKDIDKQLEILSMAYKIWQANGNKEFLKKYPHTT